MTDTSLEYTESPTTQRFLFTAKGGDFFGLAMKSIFLSIITLGIYWFWAKVEITKFLYNNTKFQGYSFDYHATGKEKFIGFLKGLGILFVFGLFNFVVIWVLTKIFGDSTAQIISTFIIYLVVFSVLPIIIIVALRFRLSRTSFNGIRFQFGIQKGFQNEISHFFGIFHFLFKFLNFLMGNCEGKIFSHFSSL